MPNYGKRAKGLEKPEVAFRFWDRTIKDLSLLSENESNEIDSIDAKINEGLIELSKILNEPRSPETYRDGKRLVNELNNLSGRIDSIVKSVNDRYNEISGDLYKFDIVRYQMSEEDAKEYTALNERLREVNKYREARGLKIEINRLKSFKASAEKRQREGVPYSYTPEELQEAIDILNAKLEALGDVVEIPEGTGPIELRIKDSIKDILSKYKTEEGIQEVKPTAIEAAPVQITEPVAEVVTPITEPTAEVEATTAVSEEETELIADIELDENKIEELKEEIQSEKGNIKEELERLRGEIVNVRAKKLPADEKRELIEELKGEIQGAKDDNESLIDLYKQDINALKADIRKAQKKLDKIREKKATAAPVAVPVAKRPVVEAVDISAENFAESFPSLYSFLKSGAVYRSGLSDSAGKKKN